MQRQRSRFFLTKQARLEKIIGLLEKTKGIINIDKATRNSMIMQFDDIIAGDEEIAACAEYLSIKPTSAMMFVGFALGYMRRIQEEQNLFGSSQN